MRKSRKRLITAVVLACLAGLLWLFFYPDVSRLGTGGNPGKTAFMKYRENEWRKEGKKYEIRQIWVPLSRVSPYAVKAVLIAEDDKFWHHEGFDFEALEKAIEKDIKAGKFKAGGSTITQQLAKNLYLSPSKNPIRKLREAIIAWRLERALTKKRILELYLNVAEWGDAGIFGIESAARHYYGKSASGLSPLEAARLAAILPNPRKWSPLKDSGYAARRAETIVKIMSKRGVIGPEYAPEQDADVQNTPASQ